MDRGRCTAFDALQAWSTTSGIRGVNTASALEYDTVPPGSIVDLAVVGSGSSSVTLTWSAPGDDGAAGRARAYDVRYSIAPIDAGNIDNASQLSFPPRPFDPGSQEVVEIIGLDGSTTYHFAVRAIDNVGNLGAISNATSSATAP